MHFFSNSNKQLPTSRSQRGFTLIEVMVALLIVAVALPALLSQVISQVDGTGYLREKSFANWVAQNQIAIQKAEYQLSGKMLQGQATGQTEMAERTWYWQIESEKTEVDGMWRQTVSVGPEQDNFIVSVVSFINE